LVAPLLEIEGVSASYGAVEVLHTVSLELRAGELLLLAGANGAGKSTLMRVIAGLHSASSGSIRFDGEDVTAVRPHLRARRGLAWIPEGRGVIPELTVKENLELARFGLHCTQESMAASLDRYPILGRSLKRQAGTLSGGEQQMLALGRALASGPKLLVVDEPSLGLAPKIVEDVMEILRDLQAEGNSILLVEQRAAQVQHVASRILLMRQGHVSEAPEAIKFTEMDFADFAAGDSAGGDR
jgi:branched-chain amino acid transport system ATP-binding protein